MKTVNIKAKDEKDFFLKYRNETVFNDVNTVAEVFDHFDKNKDTVLEKADFDRILKALFKFNGNSYYVPARKIQAMFDYFKDDEIGKIKFEGFQKFWSTIVKQTLFPRSAFIIVDVQNDFIDGTLSLRNCPSQHNGAEIIPLINGLIQNSHFQVIGYTLDWHPKNHCSFIENVNSRKISPNSKIKSNFKTFDTVIFDNNPSIEQKLWPAHCINETIGAELHKDLKLADIDRDEMHRKVIYAKKGVNPEVDSYSPFFNNQKGNETTLNEDLKNEGITDLYICGLAYDVCVAYTALDALKLGYRVVIVQDCCRGVDLDSINKQKEALINQGAILCDSNQVVDMINCDDRRPELAYSTFLSLD